MTKVIATFEKLFRHHPLHPAMVVLGILLIAATAKLGHGGWGIGGLLAFYPLYLVILAAGRGAAATLWRFGPVQRTPSHAYARVRR